MPARRYIIVVFSFVFLSELGVSTFLIIFQALKVISEISSVTMSGGGAASSSFLSSTTSSSYSSYQPSTSPANTRREPPPPSNNWGGVSAAPPQQSRPPPPTPSGKNEHKIKSYLNCYPRSTSTFSARKTSPRTGTSTPGQAWTWWPSTPYDSLVSSFQS